MAHRLLITGKDAFHRVPNRFKAIGGRGGTRPYLLVGAALVVVGLALNAFGHNPDTSYCKVAITPKEVLCKFTYDFLTLQKMTTLDANGDGQVSRNELEAAFP